MIKRVFLEEVASNIRPPSMEELAGRSIQARGRALWRQKKCGLFHKWLEVQGSWNTEMGVRQDERGGKE